MSSTVDEQYLSDGDLEYPHKDPDKKTNTLYVICLSFVVFFVILRNFNHCLIY